jgi:serine phosphatase RsbU (regulator of sigma subunit)/pSer/pThr/pTyr-binding forkhead associated (FHA) protein
VSRDPLRLSVEPPGQPSFPWESSSDSAVVGRSSGADVHVQDRYLSRQHARLFRRDDGWYVETLSAKSPTVLNGIAISGPARVAPGDVLRFAETVVRVVAPGGTSSGAGGGPLGSQVFRSAATLLEASVLGVAADPAGLERQRSRLAALNEVHRALAQTISLEALLDLVLDRAFAHLHPEEGALYLKRGDGELERVAFRRLPGVAGEPFQSRRLAEEVVGRGLAALVQDASVDDRFAAAESIMLSGVRSIVAAPLLDSEGCLGMIVLHSRAHVRRFAEDDLELLVSLAAAAALRIRNIALTEEVAEQRLLERELALAAEIQMGMLPRDFPDRPEVEIAATLQPARQVGGDLYDVVAADPRLWFLVGDVAGKGVGAALFMAVTRTLFRAVVPTAASLTDAVARMGDELARDNDKAMFVTAFLGCLDLPTGRLEFVNAGHPPPFVLGSDGTVSALDARPGPPLGALASHTYAPGSHVLRPGEGLVLYTDGITEAEAGTLEQFQAARLEGVLAGVARAGAAEVVAALMGAVRDFVGDNPPSDDLTALVLRYRGPAGAAAPDARRGG